MVSDTHRTAPDFRVGRTGAHWSDMQGSLVAAVLEVAHRQHGAITTDQLRRLGVSAKAQRTAVRHGWVAIDPTGIVVTTATPDSWHRRLHIAVLALDRRAWVSHDAAAQLYGFPMTPADRVELTLPRSARGLRTDLAVHTTDDVADGDVRTVQALRCTSPARTIIDLAHAGVPAARLVATIADAERRGLTTAVAVSARLAASRGPGRCGVRTLDAVLATAVAPALRRVA